MRSKAYRYILPAMMVFATLAVRPAVGQVVNTDPTWNGSSTISSFGYPDTSTYGEVITAPGSTTTLSGISFDLGVPAGLEFQVFVAPWDNSSYDILGGTGAILYTSSTLTSATSNMVPYILNGLSVPVTAGDMYVLGVTVDNNYGADSSSGAGAMGGNIFANGNSTNYFVWSNDGGDISVLASNWNIQGCAGNGGSCGQGAFQVGFDGSSVSAPPSVAPEPGTMALLGSGLLSLLGLARRRRS